MANGLVLAIGMRLNLAHSSDKNNFSALKGPKKNFKMRVEFVTAKNFAVFSSPVAAPAHSVPQQDEVAFSAYLCAIIIKIFIFEILTFASPAHRHACPRACIHQL